MINKIRRRGSTIQAIRETLIDKSGGLVLDVPSWLEKIEQQLKTLQNQISNIQVYIQLLRDTILRASQNTEIAPEVLAELQNRLGSAVKYTLKMNKDSILNQEEALAAYTAALHTFTIDRYPLQYAKTQYVIGTIYAENLEGNKQENSEQAIARFEEGPSEFPHVKIFLSVGQLFRAI